MSTFNVRGCRDPLKRRRIKDLFKSHKCSLVNLQETHCTSNDEATKWTNEWIKDEPCVWKNEKCEHVSSNFTSRSRGAMSLLDNSKMFMVDSKILFEGRVTFALLKIHDFDIDNLMLVNIYAPNDKKDRSNFFKICCKK